MKTQHVYRLAVKYPEGSLEPGWEPENWDGLPDDFSYAEDPNVHFRWPRVKTYLSKTGAEARAKLLRSFGAAVTVQESEPVVWP